VLTGKFTQNKSPKIKEIFEQNELFSQKRGILWHQTVKGKEK